MKTEDADTTSSIVEFADKLRTDAVGKAAPSQPVGALLQEVVTPDETAELSASSSEVAGMLAETVSEGYYDPAEVSVVITASVNPEPFVKANESFKELGDLLRTLSRPRRSRQVRGKRARNYVRALARNNAGSDINLQADRIRQEGVATGAVGDLRRHNDARAEEARKRARE